MHTPFYYSTFVSIFGGFGKVMYKPLTNLICDDTACEQRALKGSTCWCCFMLWFVHTGAG